MVSYKLLRDSFIYTILLDNKNLYNCKRRQSLFLGDTTFVFDSNNQLKATIKQHYFIFINLGYKFICEDGKVFKLKSRNGNWLLFTGTDIYTIKYGWFDKDEIVYKNNLPIGNSKLKKSNYSSKEIQIQSETEYDCFIISLMEIAIDDWGL